MSLETGPRKFVVFVDSLGPDDVEGYTEFIRNNVYDGQMDVGNPYVTPKVLGEIYTGKNPAGHGLPSVSRYNQPSRTRPAAITLPEIVAESEKYDNVCQFGLPFILPAQADPDGMYWTASGAMGQQSIQPPDAQPHLFVPGPAGDISDLDEDGGLLFNHRVDRVRNTFGTARTLADMQDFDVMFISTRILDSYVHYRYNEPEDEELTDRQLLLRRVIDDEIQDLTRLGDVFVFGDHGGRSMTDLFKINVWLKDNGYLDYEIDEAFIDRLREEEIMDDQDVPGTVYRVGQPGVSIDEENSVAVCDDPFSTGLTLLDGADEDNVRALIDDLEATEYIDWVDITTELWEGPYAHEAPDLYPRRKEGVYVSGNLAREKGGPEITRTGVHHPRAAWGSTVDLDAPDEIHPTDMFSLILDFLDLDPPAGQKHQDYGATVDEEAEEAARERLQDLGYL